jgi:hypothetical protein
MGPSAPAAPVGVTAAPDELDCPAEVALLLVVRGWEVVELEVRLPETNTAGDACGVSAETGGDGMLRCATAS